MKIRSITYFFDLSYPLDLHKLDEAGDFLKTAQPAFIEFGYEVQSARLACPPFTQVLAGQLLSFLPQFAAEFEKAAASRGYAYVSLGPALPGSPESYEHIPGAIAATGNAFYAGSMTSLDGDISLDAVHRCAEIIKRASRISADGFGNLRFAALANVPPGSPFFPAAYHQGGASSFALATEAADLAVDAFTGASNLTQARDRLVHLVEVNGNRLTTVARRIEAGSGAQFGGIDFSLAPFPLEERSLGAALEKLGLPSLGKLGSLSAAAFLADALDRARFQRAGFSGLMLPVLEDATLARCAAQGSLELKDLLLYSAVCGTGLDCIPLPGDATVDQLYAVLLDVASLSARLAKPLTARLLPIPGKQAGDPTGFDFAYFANSRVMALPAEPLNGLLNGNDSFNLHPRNRSG